MILGFTGTRDGMTASQQASFRGLLTEEVTGFHHGCCLGADADAARIAAEAGHMIVFGHPSDLPAMTSKVAVAGCDAVCPPQPPLARNRAIVSACESLIACPKGFAEERRSGTWATVRHAVRTGKPVTVVWPDGTVSTKWGT